MNILLVLALFLGLGLALAQESIPSTSPSISPANYELFAVVGGSECAEQLFYGPSPITPTGSADGHAYYLCTSTPSGARPHSQWLQLITNSTGGELFRIYWTFSDSKSLAQRFTAATSSGTAVSYRVVDTTGITGPVGIAYTFSGIWWYSDTAAITLSKFTVAQSTAVFSADDGIWGGAMGQVNGNNATVPKTFWGQGNFNLGDATCGALYANGVLQAENGKSLMYLMPTTAAPSTAPTQRPSTIAPSAAPSTLAPSSPTKAPTTMDDYELFAVLGGAECAEALYYGPSALSTSGSADGHAFYLWTQSPYAKIEHSEWLQIVTSDGSNELFRVYWSFSDYKTLSQRFSAAPSTGQVVSYRVVDTAGLNGVAGKGYTYSGSWRFSNGASISAAKFNVLASTLGFSADDGAWGAGSGTVDANGVMGTSFWGQGNFDATDANCRNVYANSVLFAYTNSKSFMYVLKGAPLPTIAPTDGPTRAPTAVPSAPPSKAPTAAPSTREPTALPTRQPSLAPSVAPTRMPSASPTRSPSLVPSTAPTAPTAAPNTPTYELFATLRSSQCAESLWYGPSAITAAGSADGHAAYLCTSTAYGNNAHSQWLQVIYSTSSNAELFRIYWTFASAKTLMERFTLAPTQPQAVSYRVIDTSGVNGLLGQEYTYSGNWYFSNGASMSTSKFSSAVSVLGFSADDGAWGAGSGTVDGNGAVSTSFWGQANFNAADNGCDSVYRSGGVLGGVTGRSELYLLAGPPQPSVLPTLRPSAAPSIAPTRLPSKDPSLAPTRRPTQIPSSTAPTLTRSPSILLTDEYELFAVIGGAECAEGLYYGPSPISTAGSADGHGYYFATNTAYGGLAHTDWLQIVTADGSAEMFRIYWSFTTSRTLSQRFIDAPSSPQAVSYHVVDTSGIGGIIGQAYDFSTTWRFSNSAQMTAAKFAVSSSTLGFSADDGAWGAAAGVVDGNGVTPSSFWGQGNFDAGDFGTCASIYAGGLYSVAYTGSKSFMYLRKSIPMPTVAPSIRPPTNAPVMSSSMPTTLSSSGPTSAPPIASEELFAVIGGFECAESLYYGPSPISTAGSADGRAYYLCTNTASGNTAHSDWLQIVTDTANNELFRIYWTFASSKTLSQRFVNAVAVGEAVSYRVVDTTGLAGAAGQEYFFSANWRFSNGAAITASKFTVSASTIGFSSDDGAWGAATGSIDANGVRPSSFWGQGNFDGVDSDCSHVYVNGLWVSSAGRSFLYLRKAIAPSALPTVSPSAVPTQAPKFLINQQVVLSNVAASGTLTVGGQEAMLQAIALTIGVDRAWVQYISSTVYSSNLALQAGITVNTQTTVDMAAYASAGDMGAVFTMLSDLLTQAVQAGAFENTLRNQSSAYAAPELSAVTANSAVSFNAGIASTAPSAAPTQAPGAKATSDTVLIIIIVAAGGGGMACMGLLVFLCCACGGRQCCQSTPAVDPFAPAQEAQVQISIAPVEAIPQPQYDIEMANAKYLPSAPPAEGAGAGIYVPDAQRLSMNVTSDAVLATNVQIVTINPENVQMI